MNSAIYNYEFALQVELSVLNIRLPPLYTLYTVKRFNNVK